MFPLNQVPVFHKTRIAPTPSGYLHLGNLFSFILTAGLARKSGAGILLRIDDLDQDRVRDQYLEDIFDTLRFFDLPWQEGPSGMADFKGNWSQLTRMELYQAALDHLADRGLVYACTCSRALMAKAGKTGHCPGDCLHRNLPLDTPGACWRYWTSSSQKISFSGINGVPGTYSFPDTMFGWVVRKKDGFPSYQLASVMDDDYYGVDLIVRGMDLLDSTLVQLDLSRNLPGSHFMHTVFYHHALLTHETGEKLSKSAGHTSITGLRKSGLDAPGILRVLGRQLGLDQTYSHWSELFDAFAVMNPDLKPWAGRLFR